jgi:hypothetical protein
MGATPAWSQSKESESAPAKVRASAPVRNYAISFFSDLGYPRVRVQGASADVSDPSRIVLGDMILELFSGDEHKTTESVLIAPVAVLEPEPEVVSGPESVRFTRSDMEITGENWSYEHRERRIHIRQRARIVFNTGLNDILK